MFRPVFLVLVLSGCAFMPGLGLVELAFGADVYFSPVDSIQFSSPDDILQWRLIDINGDGLQELVALTSDNYYVFSFARDSTLLADNNGNGLQLVGQYVTDYDKDGQLDLLVLDRGGRLFLQSGIAAPNKRIIDTLLPFWGPAVSPHGINLDLVDLAHDGDTTLVGGGLAEYLISMEIPRDVEVYDAGNIAALRSSDFSTVWWQHATYIPSSEDLACLNLTGDSVLNVCTWGQSYHEWTVHPPWGGEYQERIYGHQFCVYDHVGAIVKTAAATSGIAAIGGDLIPGRTSDVILVVKDGPSFDSTIFQPGNQWGAYCLGIEGDTLAILWAKDAVGESQEDLFRLTGIPHSYCAWTSTTHCGVFSGADGSEVSQIHGLRPGLATQEGILTAGNDSLMQVVQVAGKSAILYRQQTASEVRGMDRPLPASFVLWQNYPNPFNGGTTIRFNLARRERVKLDVLNLLGQPVVTLADGQLAVGPHSVRWDGSDRNGHPAASGVYLYRLSAGNDSQTRKMILLK